jgi:predicted TIM-barrel fold metal-dependent hydrolase
MNELGEPAVTVIDAVCNLLTPEILAQRPSWVRDFLGSKVGAGEAVLRGTSGEELIGVLDAAGIDHALLIAPWMGKVGLPGRWRMPPSLVEAEVQNHPNRFRGLLGVAPGMSASETSTVRELIGTGAFIGVHLYPHWFEMAPDAPDYYSTYELCCDLDIPIQMQVGHCLRYFSDAPLRSVGFPAAVDAIACRFPELRLVGIHMGWPWVEEMISVATLHRNVFIGTDAYAPAYWPEELVKFINSPVGRYKVVFGTDWPVVGLQRATSDVSRLSLGYTSRALLLGGNAKRIYNWPID